MSKPKNWKQKEKWVPIRGYERFYEVSQMGRVRTTGRVRYPVSAVFKRHRIKRRLMRACVTPSHPNPKIGLRNADGVRKFYDLKYIVANHHLRPRTGALVDYIDPLNKEDCSIYNLRERGSNDKRYNAKFRKKDVARLKQTLLDEWGQRGVRARLAREFNVSKSIITLICKGERWADIEPRLPSQNDSIQN